MKITYYPIAQAATADTWSLEGGPDAASRSRLFVHGELASDIALSDGFVEWRTDDGQIIESPAPSRMSPDPFTIADEMVEAGALTKAETVTRDGRELQVYTGSPEYFLLAGAKGSFTPVDAELRYLRDDAAGRPVELRVPAATVTKESVSNERTPTQRFVVTGFREYPATEEAMKVFDLKAAYDGAGTGTTTAP